MMPPLGEHLRMMRHRGYLGGRRPRGVVAELEPLGCTTLRWHCLAKQLFEMVVATGVLEMVVATGAVG